MAKLVDLPCPIESQKTFDRKQFYKVCSGRSAQGDGYLINALFVYLHALSKLTVALHRWPTFVK